MSCVKPRGTLNRIADASMSAMPWWSRREASFVRSSASVAAAPRSTNDPDNTPVPIARGTNHCFGTTPRGRSTSSGAPSIASNAANTAGSGRNRANVSIWHLPARWRHRARGTCHGDRRIGSRRCRRDRHRPSPATQTDWAVDQRGGSTPVGLPASSASEKRSSCSHHQRADLVEIALAEQSGRRAIIEFRIETREP